ncbi:hypothetical protein KSP39_PZI008439 [Platanthera zijinensis]|uniref:Uncharacterized protein n=1 Tax=Platanthera zijinensis TaxID=2320716 RepID=A0AAP0BQ17_9ASPA
MPSGEKQPPVSAKKVTLRDLPSEATNFASYPLDHPPLKDRGSVLDTTRLSGIKRDEPGSPFTPPHPHQHSILNGHLVYVRRKLDTEPNKACTENKEHTVSPYFSNCTKYHSSEAKSLEEHEAKLYGVSTPLLSPASLISSLGSGHLPSTRRPINLVAISLTDQSSISLAPQPETRYQGEGYWKERFIRLQMYLKNCDQYDQEKYFQSLRSLSATGRSLHAVALEKRAIQLLLDEERELHKMKVLNVLGRPLIAGSHASLHYQAFSPEPVALEK